MGSNPFAMLGGNTPTIGQLLEQIKADPTQLLRRRWNIPQGVDMRDPNSILQHLVNTGQVTQAQYNAAFQQAQKLGLK